MTQIRTGPSANLREILDNTSTTSSFKDDRRSVFIEIRERGSDSIICKNDIGVLSHLGIRDKYLRHRLINFGRDVVNANFIEVFTTKQGIVTFKKCSFPNISTPYILQLSAIKSDEIVLSNGQFFILTNRALRAAFTREVYELAKLENPIYKVSALAAMEQYFFSLAMNNEIPREIAEKRFDKYDKIKSRIWRGATPGEQLNAFSAAFNLLSTVCNLKMKESE